MADAFLTLLDMTKQRGTDQAVGVVEEVRTFAPEVDIIRGRPIKGISYKALVRSAIPLGPAFRKANVGSSVVASKWDQRLNECFFFDGQMRVDEAVLDASEFGADWTLANEAVGVTKTKMINLGAQVYYGTAQDAAGFPGLVSLYDANNMEVLAGGVGATTSSAWLIVNAPDMVEFIYGKNMGLQLKQWTPQYVTDANNKQYRAFLNNLSGYVGLSFNYTKAACRIKNLNSTDKGLTDALVADALALFPVGTIPTHILCNRTQRRLLQKSRAPVQTNGASAITAATPLAYPSIPTESNGIPLYVTDSITQIEDATVAGTAV
jgi:hypothetical protein